MGKEEKRPTHKNFSNNPGHNILCKTGSVTFGHLRALTGSHECKSNQIKNIVNQNQVTVTQALTALKANIIFTCNIIVNNDSV